MLRVAASRARQLAQAAPKFGKFARGFAAEADAPKSGGGVGWVVGLAAIGAGAYYAKEQGLLDSFLGAPPAAKAGAVPDYGAVKKAVANLLEANPDYDDGSYGPLLVRLAWHTSGTYDKNSGTGGSNGATMRFSPESNWGANAGLAVARDLLEPVKRRFPWISYADLWTLAGATAIEEMGGPVIPWRAGRSDKEEANAVPLPDGRLPDGDKDAAHVRAIFYRMGFNDQEIVALSGAHALGRCHPDRSGWDGPWTNAPTTFSNLYFTELKENTWRKKKWSGPLQYEDKSKQLMMLPTDMALLWDRRFRKHVDAYAKDQDAFFADFSAAFSKLLELGVPFAEPGAASPKPTA